MAPNQHDEQSGGASRVSVRGDRSPESAPLLDSRGAATVEPGTTNSQTPTKSFYGEGVTIRAAVEPRNPRGLITEADQMYEDVDRCCGYEGAARSVLARLPALHTYTVIACFTFVGRWWLLIERPDVAVAIVGTLMCYGILRFWTMWCSAFHAIWQLKKYDSRDPNKWQKMPRPMGSPEFGNIWHAIIVPNYKEPIEKLRMTLDTIATQSIASQIVVCMGMESRDPQGQEVAVQLQAEYADKLGGLCYALHPLVEGEVAGKSSNENWAARCVKMLMVDRMRINPDHIVLTTCDADTYFHPNHFALLTHHFLSDGLDRYHRFYLPVTNFLPNVLHVPAICSARYTMLSVGRMAELGNPLADPFPLAIYSLSLRLATKAAYWDPSVIPEDWHMYFRCVFADQGRVKCTRMMMAVGTEAVEGKGYLDTVRECYLQSVRWQWGAIDVGYLIVQGVTRWDVSLFKRWSLLYAAYDHHLLVVVVCLMLTTAPFLYGRIPVLADINLWTGEPEVLRLSDVMIYTWALHFFFHFSFLCYADNSLRTTILRDRLHFDVDVGSSVWAKCKRAVGLLTFPAADMLLFVVPTVHAHTKMFFSSNFTYIPSAKLGKKACCCLSDDSKEPSSTHV